MSSPAIIPPPRLEPRGERQFWVWSLLIFLVICLIAAAVASRYDKEKGIKKTYIIETAEIKSFLSTRALSEKLMSGLGSSQSPKTSGSKVLNQVLARVEKHGIDNSDAARISVLLRSELGKPASISAQNFLAKSRRIGDSDFNQISKGVLPNPSHLNANSDDILERYAVAISRKIEGQKNPYRSVVDSNAVLNLLVLGVTFFASVAVGICVWIFYLIAPHTWPILKMQYPIGTLTPADGDRLAGRVVLYLALYVFLGTVLALAIRRLPIPIALQSVIITSVVFAVLLISLQGKLFGVADPWGKVIGAKKPLPLLVGVGLLAVFADLPLLLVSGVLSAGLGKIFPSPSHPIEAQIANARDPVTIICLFITAAVLAPLVEETVFRGLCMPAIGAVMKSPWWGITLSGFIFASMHPQGPAGWPPLMALGMFCGYLAYQTGSLVPGIVLHAVHNASLIVLSMVMNGR